MFDFLRQPKLIIASLMIAIGLVFGFSVWTPSTGGVILDRLSSLEDTRALLASMTAAQKNSHFWMTLLLDYAFPLAYGAFFAGLALQFPGRIGMALAVPAFLVFGADVIENMVQLLALKGVDGLLFTKEFLTPAKFFFFNVAAAIALTSLIWFGLSFAYAKFRSPRPDSSSLSDMFEDPADAGTAGG